MHKGMKSLLYDVSWNNDIKLARDYDTYQMRIYITGRYPKRMGRQINATAVKIESAGAA